MLYKNNVFAFAEVIYKTYKLYKQPNNSQYTSILAVIYVNKQFSETD